MEAGDPFLQELEDAGLNEVKARLGQRFHDLNHIRLPRRAYMTKCG